MYSKTVYMLYFATVLVSFILVVEGQETKAKRKVSEIAVIYVYLCLYIKIVTLSKI